MTLPYVQLSAGAKRCPRNWVTDVIERQQIVQAAEWDRNYQGSGSKRHWITTASHLIRRRFELYRRVFPLAPGRDLLEVGCAPGDWLVTFAREFGLNPTGIDFASTGCELARQKLKEAGIEGKVIEGDFLVADLPREAFDILFFQGSLEHFRDPVEGLRKALGLIRPGGLVCAQIPCLARWHINGIINRILDSDGLADHYTRDLESMERAFTAAGLCNVESVQFGSFQLILNPRTSGSVSFRLARRIIATVDFAIGTFLNMTDLRSDWLPVSPHILTWGFRPRTNS
jgi:SAM-dependent methyltransferase